MAAPATASAAPSLKQIQPLAFILNAQFTIKRTDAEAFLAATKLVYDAVLKEPECVFYQIGRLDPIQPTWLTAQPETSETEECVIWFSEGWNCSLEWYRDVQFKKDYYGPHMKVAGKMWIKPPVFELVRPEEGFCHYKEGM